MDILNMHTHLFTHENSPRDFLKLYLPSFMARGIDTFTNGKVGAWIVQHIGPVFGNAGKRYASFMKIGKSESQGGVLEKLIQSYPRGTKFVALSMFMEEMGVGSSFSGYEGQLEQLILLKGRYPEELLVFLGIDPRWQPASQLSLANAVRKYFTCTVTRNNKTYPVFNGLKLYPSTGFYVFDERLKETLEWAAEQEVPVVTHCNYLGGVYNNSESFIRANLNTSLRHYGIDGDYNAFCARKGYRAPAYQMANAPFIKRLIGMRDEKRNMVSCSFFLEPYSYEPVLEYFNRYGGKPLNICLAHYGGDIQIQLSEGMEPKGADELEKNPVGIGMLNWTTQIRNLMQRFDSVYTDISYAYVSKNVPPILFNDILQKPYGNRILFGTDFYMTERVGKEQDNFSGFKKLAMEKLNQDGKPVWDILMESNYNFLKMGMNEQYKP